MSFLRPAHHGTLPELLASYAVKTIAAQAGFMRLRKQNTAMSELVVVVRTIMKIVIASVSEAIH
jgi:hypothetical protein